VILRYLTANIFVAVVIVLVIQDPTRPLWQILAPLALAVACIVVPRWLVK
jgi:hypothetical protein